MDLSRTSDSDESFLGGSEISHESLGERKVRVLIWSLTVTQIWLIFLSREQFALAVIKLFANCNAKILHLIGQHCLGYSKHRIVYGPLYEREFGMIDLSFIHADPAGTITGNPLMCKLL